MATILLPVSLPVSFTDKRTEGTIILPVKLPIKFYSSAVTKGKVKLPITLPMKFSDGSSVNRKRIKLPLSEAPLEGVFKSSIKLPLIETASINSIRIPVTETPWDFKGLIIEENVVGTMNSSLTLIEEIRSRILTEVEILNRNTVKVKWYGDEVPKLELMKKVAGDEDYESVGVYEWTDGEAVFEISNNEHNIQLIGLNGTGESAIVELGEGEMVDINTQLNILLNEKIYDINVDYTSQFKINVNY